MATRMQDIPENKILTNHLSNISPKLARMTRRTIQNSSPENINPINGHHVEEHDNLTTVVSDVLINGENNIKLVNGSLKKENTKLELTNGYHVEKITPNGSITPDNIKSRSKNTSGHSSSSNRSRRCSGRLKEAAARQNGDALDIIKQELPASIDEALEEQPQVENNEETKEQEDKEVVEVNKTTDGSAVPPKRELWIRKHWIYGYVHKTDPPWICPMCGVSYENKTTIDQHFRYYVHGLGKVSVGNVTEEYLPLGVKNPTMPDGWVCPKPGRASGTFKSNVNSPGGASTPNWQAIALQNRENRLANQTNGSSPLNQSNLVNTLDQMGSASRKRRKKRAGASYSIYNQRQKYRLKKYKELHGFLPGQNGNLPSGLDSDLLPGNRLDLLPSLSSRKKGPIITTEVSNPNLRESTLTWAQAQRLVEINTLEIENKNAEKRRERRELNNAEFMKRHNQQKIERSKSSEQEQSVSGTSGSAFDIQPNIEISNEPPDLSASTTEQPISKANSTSSVHFNHSEALSVRSCSSSSKFSSAYVPKSEKMERLDIYKIINLQDEETALAIAVGEKNENDIEKYDKNNDKMKRILPPDMESLVDKFKKLKENKSSGEITSIAVNKNNTNLVEKKRNKLIEDSPSKRTRSKSYEDNSSTKELVRKDSKTGSIFSEADSSDVSASTQGSKASSKNKTNKFVTSLKSRGWKSYLIIIILFYCSNENISPAFNPFIPKYLLQNCFVSTANLLKNFSSS